MLPNRRMRWDGEHDLPLPCTRMCLHPPLAQPPQAASVPRDQASSPPSTSSPRGKWDQLISSLAMGDGFPRASFQLCKSLTPSRAWLEGASSLPRLAALPSSSRAIYLERAKRSPSKAMSNAWLIPSRRQGSSQGNRAFCLPDPGGDSWRESLLLPVKINTFLIRDQRGQLSSWFTSAGPAVPGQMSGHWVHQGPATEHCRD